MRKGLKLPFTWRSNLLTRLYEAFIFVVVTLLLLILLLLAGCGSRPKEGEATLRILPGTSAWQIARMLVEENIIDSEEEFMQKAEETGAAGRLKAGTYRFQRGESIESILEKLENGWQAPEGFLTIPEGYRLTEIAKLVSSKTSIPESKYVEAAAAAGKKLPLSGAEKAQTLEGFLFPSTYNLDPDIDAAGLLDQQLETFKEKTSSLDWDGKKGLRTAPASVTPYQILIVASMVEREAKVPEERPLVAAVIYNRIAAGMKLEVDATVQYALGYWKKELTQEDLQVDSPYNTRLYAGLPPGPICNPGLDSIRAALQPAPVDYIYYVATGDEAGHHFFTSSYEEFLRAKAGN